MDTLMQGATRHAVLILLTFVCAEAGSFTDDSGTKHTWSSDKPKIVAWSFDALALYHMGMGTDQLIGTYGERSMSGSNHGGYYHDGNAVDHGDHGNAPYDPDLFPSDPTTEDRQFLTSLEDFSPSCSSTNYWCADFNLTVMAENKPDVIIQGPMATLSDADVLYEIKRNGIPIIQMNGAYDGREDRGVGMIEITERFEELAIALGVPESKVAEATDADKVRLCSAVSSFRQAAKAAQNEGVRALAAYVPYGPHGPNGEAGAFIATPETDPVLCMLEELGMPLMHNNNEVETGKGTSKNWEYAVTPDWSAGTLDANNLKSSEGPDSPSVPYPVDFWLYDQRVTLDFLSDSFAEKWPDKALLAKQYAYWPSGGGVFSYRHCAEILEEVAANLKDATRIHTDIDTQCTPVAWGGLKGEKHRVHGMKPGEYPCYQPVCYEMCSKYRDPSDECTFQVDSKMIAGYEAGTDVSDALDLDHEQKELETYLKESPPNFAEAKKIYQDGAQSSLSLAGLSTDAEDMMSGQPVFEKFRSYYGSADYGNQYVMSALDGTGAFSGQEDVARVEGTKKGTAYMNVWMAIVGMMQKGITDCSVTSWNIAVALYTGSLEGEEFKAGGGKMIFALADKRCKNFNTCAGNTNSGSSQINTAIFKLFKQGQALIKDNKCTSATTIMDFIVSRMTVPLVQGSLRYAYKVAELQGGAKEKGEGAVFSAAVLPLISSCSESAATTISDNMKIDAASPMKDGFAAVKTAFESTYTCLGIHCEHVGGLLLTSTSYYPGASPCGSGITGYMPDSVVSDALFLDHEQKDLETYLKETPPNFAEAKQIYEGSDLASLSTDAESVMGGQAVFEKFKTYYGAADYANQYVMAALDGTGAFDGQEDVARVEGTKKGTAYMNVWMAIVGMMQTGITDCSTLGWDTAVALYSGSLEGTDFKAGGGKMIFALADKRCKNFNTCVGMTNSGSSEVNTEIFKLFKQGQALIKDNKCSEATAIMNSIVSLMTVPLVQGSLRYAYKVAELQGGAKEKGEGAVFSTAVLPLISSCSESAATTISDNMKIDAASPMKDGFAAVKTAFESTYSCLGITCAHVGGLLLTTTEYYDGASPCNTAITGYMPETVVSSALLLDHEQKELETYLKESPPNFAEAKKIYQDGAQSSLSLAGLSIDADSMMAGLPVFEKFKSYYGSADYGNQYVMAALHGSGAFNGQEDVARVEGTKKGTAYMNVWMYIMGMMHKGIAECSILHWDMAVALYSGSLEGTDFKAGGGKMIYALADKRCKNFKTCAGKTNSGSSEVNTEIFKLFKEGQAKIKDQKCSEATAIMDSIVSLMTVPLVQGSLRYAYKVAELQGGAKEKGEGAVFSAAVLPLISSCSESAATTISDNMKIDAASPMKDGFAAVKTAFESTYTCLGITCEHVGGLLLTATTYYDGASPCGASSGGGDDGTSQDADADAAIVSYMTGVVGTLVMCLLFRGV